MTGGVGGVVLSPGLLDLLGRLALHGGPHGTGSQSTVQVEFVAGSVAFVGLVGGLLYWYYGRRMEST